MTGAQAPDQLALEGVGVPRRRRTRAPEPAADELPVARVLLDVGLPHLDRPFDYLVPASMAAAAVPGARVSVRFAGADHGGFVSERCAGSDHAGKLSRLRRVVSAEPVLAPEIIRLARVVADRYAGTVADVLRLAVPPRHARAESGSSGEPVDPPEPPDPGQWASHVDGSAFVAAVAAGGTPRAVWNPGPGMAWPDLLARLVLATLAGDRGALVILPDARDVERVDAALRVLAGADQGPVQDTVQHTILLADLGPAERYRRWLAVRRGVVRAVVGTRSAMFAPVADLGLVAIWDDGDDLHAEPRAPYPHAREVLLLRAHHEGAAAVVGGLARTAEAEQLIRSGWARELAPSRTVVRSSAPRTRVAGDEVEQSRDEAARTARLPSVAWRIARDALRRGPVLVQVPRAGYVPGLACARCRAPARCASCRGPMLLPDGRAAPECRWCGSDAAWACGSCGGTGMRAMSVGVGRTAEELGRAFAGVAVRMSRGESVIAAVDATAALVVATPGAEPVAAGGYAAALLLDGQAMLARPGLRGGEEALRRWFGAAALVRDADAGGQVVIVADAASPPVQALVRWDPGGFAARELADRHELGFPPAFRVAELTGRSEDLAELRQILELPDGASMLGPVPVGEAQERVILRVPRAGGAQLAAAIRSAQGVRSARRSGGTVRARVDPVDLA